MRAATFDLHAVNEIERQNILGPSSFPKMVPRSAPALQKVASLQLLESRVYGARSGAFPIPDEDASWPARKGGGAHAGLASAAVSLTTSRNSSIPPPQPAAPLRARAPRDAATGRFRKRRRHYPPPKEIGGLLKLKRP